MPFTANSESRNYTDNLAIEQIADILSITCGHWGSCEVSGMHDDYLWRLQELAADRIAERLQSL